jgi:hypothetical protein
MSSSKYSSITIHIHKKQKAAPTFIEAAFIMLSAYSNYPLSASAPDTISISSLVIAP